MKYKMKQGYDQTRWMPIRFRGFIDLARPFTLIAPFLGVVLGILAVGGATGLHVPWETIVFAGVTMVLVNAASNSLNQAADVDTDTISKPYRPIPQGIVKAEEARFFSFVLYAFALFRSAMISEWFSILTLSIIVMTLLYNMEPVRFKRRGWWANVAIAFPRGLLGFLAAWSVVTPPTDILPWVLGSMIMCFLIGAQNTKDYVDVLGDKQCGYITPVIKYGPTKTAFLSLPFILAPSIALMALGGPRTTFLPSSAEWVGLITFWLGVIIVHSMINHRRQDFKSLENSPSWGFMYLTLLAYMLGFAIIYNI